MFTLAHFRLVDNILSVNNNYKSENHHIVKSKSIVLELNVLIGIILSSVIRNVNRCFSYQNNVSLESNEMTPLLGNQPENNSKKIRSRRYKIMATLSFICFIIIGSICFI